MANLLEITTLYHELSFVDRIIFYTTLSNDVGVRDGEIQSFLIETRMQRETTCIYCGRDHIVKNGKRRDGVQRYLCRDCHKSFLPSSGSLVSRSRKPVSLWAAFLKCMLDKKTLEESAEKCRISKTTAFLWRHKILDTLGELTDKVCLRGIVEADETFFNVSFKGNHSKSSRFVMPREAHKRGGEVHRKGLSSDKVCVPCAISDAGISFSRPGKLGKVSSECVERILGERIAPESILCTDHERAYRNYAEINHLHLIQTGTDRRITIQGGQVYGVQRINAYHNRLKVFLRSFHGVSTKHLGNYLVWNDLISGNRRNRDELFTQLFARLLNASITRYGADISNRAPLPV